MGSRWLALLLLGCSGNLQLPLSHEPCGAVPVSAELDVTANHCPLLLPAALRVPEADIMLVRRGAPRWATLRTEPVEANSEAWLRNDPDLWFMVTDPLMWSEGRAFVRALPELEPGMSGSGLWWGGELIGVAIGNDGTHAVFAHAIEVQRALDQLEAD
jgi:hypothetical protein